MKALIAFLRPNWGKLLAFIVLLLLSMLVFVSYKPTTKVTSEQMWGAPLVFLDVSGYSGPCPPVNYCHKVHVQGFYPFELLLDVLIWYSVACVVCFVISRYGSGLINLLRFIS
ncbi:MAG: hypothetical protein AB1894_27825 [Chloroflexota bacterium]